MQLFCVQRSENRFRVVYVRLYVPRKRMKSYFLYHEIDEIRLENERIVIRFFQGLCQNTHG